LLGNATGPKRVGDFRATLAIPDALDGGTKAASRIGRALRPQFSGFDCCILPWLASPPRRLLTVQKQSGQPSDWLRIGGKSGLTPLSLGRIGPQCVTATRHARLIARTLRHKVGEVAARPDVKAEYSTPSHANQTNSPSHGCVIQPKTLPPVPS